MCFRRPLGVADEPPAEDLRNALMLLEAMEHAPEVERTAYLRDVRRRVRRALAGIEPPTTAGV